MRGQTARKLRKQAYEVWRFTKTPDSEYVQKGIQGYSKAVFGRIIMTLLDHFQRETKMLVAKNQSTIMCHPDSYRGIYKRVKREHKQR